MSRAVAVVLLAVLLAIPAAAQRWEAAGNGLQAPSKGSTNSWKGSGTLWVLASSVFDGATVELLSCGLITGAINPADCYPVSPACSLSAAGICRFGSDSGSLRLNVTVGGGSVAIDATLMNGATQASAFSGAGGGTEPAPGSNTQVLFNELGSIGAATLLGWDQSLSRLGVGTLSPASPLHVEAAPADLLRLVDTDTARVATMGHDTGILTTGFAIDNTQNPGIEFVIDNTGFIRIRGGLELSTFVGSNAGRALSVTGTVLFDDVGWQVQGTAVAQVPCNITNGGMVYFDTDILEYCFCDRTNFVQFTDATTICN